ncbi:MAG: FKBP-type peptidyl-prolyl cis-trans isomerase [Spirochaeta sp.]|jgi:FKBP-type peptidyl-prolyl cis-trans isomerase SlyD|nr:FKBP-type peptidyl-prolyl cis-trans isomerase [Spirochaeta sp.]
MKAIRDAFVTMEYTFTAPDGTLLGSSDYSGPFTFRHGYGDVVPGLDTHTQGASIGDQLTFVVDPADGYGERDEAKVRTIARDALPLGREPEPGLRVNVNDTIYVITEVTATELILDANHPLAGIPLSFDIRITDIATEDPREASSCGCGGTCSCAS